MIYYGGLEAMWSGNNYKLKNKKISQDASLASLIN